MTDGLIGDTNLRHPSWQGFLRSDLDAVIDLGRAVPLREVRARFLQNAVSWIWLPTDVTVAASTDGRRFRDVGVVRHAMPLRRMDSFVHVFQLKGDGRPARYIRIRAPSIGVCPPWHAGAGKDCWLFADELEVNPVE